MFNVNHVKNAIFELVFVLTTDNSWISYLGVTALAIDFIQMCAFGLLPDLPWHMESVQHALEYVLIPWPVNKISFFGVVVTVAMMIATISLLFRQVYSQGGVTSIAILRIGRILTSLCATIFFFPFLETFSYVIKVLVKDLNPNHVLLDYLVLSSIMAAVFFLFILAFSYLCISPDIHDMHDCTNKITTRTEVFDITARTVIVLANTLAPTSVFVIVYFVVIFLTLLINLYYPYYVMRPINYIRAGMLGSLFVLACGSLRVWFTPGEGTEAFYTVVGLMPVGGLICSALSYYRIRHVDILQFSGKDAVKQVVDRCYHFTDIELAARYATHHPSVGMKVFEAGLRKFPQNAYLHARFAIYLVFVMKVWLDNLPPEQTTMDTEAEKQKLLKTIRVFIRQTFKLKPKTDLQYLFFFIITRLEHQEAANEVGEEKLYLLDSIKYRHDMRSAQENHKRASRAIFHFWKTVHTGDFGSEAQLIRIIDVVHQSTSNAEKAYKRLIVQFPKSVKSLQCYALFFRYILHDEKSAVELEDRCAKLEQAKMDRFLRSQTSIEDENMENGGNNIYETLAVNLGRHRTGHRRESKWYFRVNQLQSYMFASLAILLCGLIFLYIYGIFFVLKDQTNNVGGLSNTFHHSRNIAYMSRQLEMLATFGQAVEDTSVEKIDTSILDMVKKMRDAFTDARSDSELNAQSTVAESWNEVDIAAKTRTSTGHISYPLVDVVSLIQMYSSNAIKLATRCTKCQKRESKIPLDRNVSHNMTDITYWAFILDNQSPVLLHSWHVAESLAEALQDIVEGNQRVLLTLLAIAASLPIIMAIGLVTPTYIFVVRDREYSLKLFNLIPKNVVQDLAQQHRNARVTDASTTGDSKSVLSTSSSTGTLNETASDIVDAPQSVIPLVARFRQSPTWIQLLIIYLGIMTLLLIVLIFCVINIYNATNLIYSSSAWVDYSGIRSAYPRHLLVLTQELVRGDKFIWEDQQVLRDMIGEQLEAAYYTHQGLKFGNATLKVEPSLNRFQLQDDLLFKQSCPDTTQFECSSLDELYAVFLQQVRTLLLYKDEELNFDIDAYRIMHHLATGPLTEKLELSKQYYIDQVAPVLKSVLYAEDIVFGISFPIAILSIIALMIISRKIRNNIDCTRRLLQMIPYECACRIPDIQMFLKKGPNMKKAKLLTSKRSTDEENIVIPQLLAPVEDAQPVDENQGEDQDSDEQENFGDEKNSDGQAATELCLEPNNTTQLSPAMASTTRMTLRRQIGDGPSTENKRLSFVDGEVPGGSAKSPIVSHRRLDDLRSSRRTTGGILRSKDMAVNEMTEEIRTSPAVPSIGSNSPDNGETSPQI